MGVDFHNWKADKNKMNQDVVIVTGGSLSESFLQTNDCKGSVLIGVDRGAEWLLDHDIVPDYFIGDFDSADANFLNKIKKDYADRIFLFSNEKDETDTELGMRLAIALQPKSITLFGGIGTRLDHTIGNIHILLQAEKVNIPAILVGENNRIQLILAKQVKKVKKSNYPYVSFIPFTEQVEGITITGFKYSLNKGIMHIGTPFGISNELIEPVGTISVEKGILLIIESKD